MNTMNTYTVTISKEILYEIEVQAANWEDACDMADAEFAIAPQNFEEIDCNWEVVDYQIVKGEEETKWASK